MVISLLLLLATITVSQDGLPSATTTAAPVSVGHVSFEPADLSVSYEQVTAPGVTFYKTEIVWRFADGTTIAETIDPDWFFSDGFIYVGLGMRVNPLSAQTLVPSTPSRPAHYVRTPKTAPPPLSVLIGVDVTVIAAIVADGTTIGDPMTLRDVFGKRQALKTEYDQWLKVIAAVWRDDSAIATLRTIVPELQQSRPDALGESLRLIIKRSAETMLHFSEQDLTQAPYLLNAFVTSIEQERNLLSEQSGAKKE